MSPFEEDLLFGVVFVYLSQAGLAVALAPALFFIVAFCRRVDYDRFLRRYALFNLLLFGWSAVGNYFWLRLTSGRFAVLDDMPVWASFVPFGRFVLNFATGGPDGWHLMGDTPMAKLRAYSGSHSDTSLATDRYQHAPLSPSSCSLTFLTSILSKWMQTPARMAPVLVSSLHACHRMIREARPKDECHSPRLE